MYFLIKADKLLENYNTIWDKISTDMKKEFDSEPVNNKEFLKTKIKSHGDEVKDFYDKKIPKVDFNHTCLAVISLVSAFKKDENYYPQAFLKECKYIVEKVVWHINDDLSDFSSSESDESDEEYFWRNEFWKCIFWGSNFENVFESLMENNFLINTGFIAFKVFQ